MIILWAPPLFIVLLFLWSLSRKPKHLPGIPRYEPIYFGLLGDLPHLIRFLRTAKTKSPSKWMKSLYGLHGPICQVVLGARRLIVLTDIQECEDVVARRKEFEKSSLFISMFISAVPNSQLSMKSTPMFKLHRRFFGPAMTSRYLSQMTPRISRGAKALVELWDAKQTLMHSDQQRNWSKAFEADEDLVYFTMDVIVDISCGHHWGCLSSAIQAVRSVGSLRIPERDGQEFSFPQNPSEDFTALRTIFQAIAALPGAPYPGLSRLRMSLRPSWRAAMARTKSFVRSEITPRRNEIRLSTTAPFNNERLGQEKLAQAVDEFEGKHDDSQTEEADCVLIMALKQGVDQKLPQKELEDELMGLLLAGQDTVAAALAWGVKFLAHAPQVQETLYKEIAILLSASGRNANPSTPEEIPHLTYSDVNSDRTPYLDAVVSESLRCANVTTTAIRDTLEDTVLLGHHIPKNSIVICVPGVAGNVNNIEERKKPWAIPPDSPIRSPSSRAAALKGVWNDDSSPENFRPERWIDFEKDDQGKFKMKYDPNKGYNMQFGGGTRGYFGKALAYLELKICIATLSLYFIFDEVPKAVDSFESKEIVTVQPADCYVCLKKRSDMPNSL